MRCTKDNLPFLGSQLLIANGQTIQTVLKVSHLRGALDLFPDFWTEQSLIAFTETTETVFEVLVTREITGLSAFLGIELRLVAFRVVIQAVLKILDFGVAVRLGGRGQRTQAYEREREERPLGRVHRVSPLWTIELLEWLTRAAENRPNRFSPIRTGVAALFWPPEIPVLVVYPL